MVAGGTERGRFVCVHLAFQIQTVAAAYSHLGLPTFSTGSAPMSSVAGLIKMLTGSAKQSPITKSPSFTFMYGKVVLKDISVGEI